MKIENAQYEVHGLQRYIRATINGAESIVPLDPDKTDYAEILKQVQEDTLTIKDTDESLELMPYQKAL